MLFDVGWLCCFVAAFVLALTILSSEKTHGGRTAYNDGGLIKVGLLSWIGCAFMGLGIMVMGVRDYREYMTVRYFMPDGEAFMWLLFATSSLSIFLVHEVVHPQR